MKIGLVQYNPVWEDKESNKEKLLSMVNNADHETRLFIFPEMTLTGFTMNPSGFAENLDDKSMCFYKEIAVQRNSHIIAGIIEQDENKYYNTLVHINSSGELITIYRKIHPFSYSNEDKNYGKGDKIVFTEIDGFKTGLSICYDLRFPELYRYYAMERVHLIVNIANWPDTRIEHWRTLLKARAIENQCYVAGVNRVGTDPKLYYNGYSSVFDPIGEEIVFSKDEEKIIIADLAPGKVEEVRSRLPFLNDICLVK